MTIIKKPAINSFLKISFKFDGVNVVSEKYHQHEKDISTTGSDFGKLNRSGDHAGVAQAGANIPK